MDQAADEPDGEAFVGHVLRLVRREGAELRDHGDREIGRVEARERAGQIAGGNETGQPAQHAPMLPARPPAEVRVHVLMREQHDGNGEPARGGEHLARRMRGGLFFYLNKIRPAVSQQRPERSARVFRFLEHAFLSHAARGQGKDLETALPFPRHVDRPAEPRLAPALWNGDRHLEPSSC